MDSKLLSIIAVLTLLTIGCSIDSSSDENTTQLPALEEVDDVCEKMDDLNFMAYCYEHFDVNNDKRVSMAEANAVTRLNCNDLEDNDILSLKGVEYFSNLTSFDSDYRVSHSFTGTLDLRYNTKLITISEYAFYKSTGLTSVIFPAGKITIETSAFEGCTELLSVDMSRCTEINFASTEAQYNQQLWNQFKNCSKLKSISIGCSNPPNPEYPYPDIFFSGISEDAVLSVPVESLDKYKHAWGTLFKNILPL